MQDKENPRGNKDASRFGRFSRTASFWILIFLIPLLIINTLTKGRQNESELNYTQFMEQLRNDNVGTVTIIEGKRIEGELRTPIMREQRSVKEFWMTLPVQNSQKVLDEIEARNIEIRGMEARQNWWVLILNFLPWLLIVGFWLFMLPDADGRLEGVPVWQVEGQASDGRYAEGHVRRRGGCR
jgi:cell division protease FtsH